MKDYTKLTDSELEEKLLECGVNADEEHLDREEMIYRLTEVNNDSVNRLTLLFFLLAHKQAGASKQEIYEKMGFAGRKEEAAKKAYRRHIDDLKFFENEIDLREDSDRVYASLKKTKGGTHEEAEQFLQNILQLLHPLDHSLNPDKFFPMNLNKGSRISSTTLKLLSHSLFHSSLLDFEYKGKSYQGICLGLCVDSGTLYAFFAVRPTWYKLTFRVELFDSIRLPSLTSSPSFTLDVTEARKELYEAIRSGNNIYVNLNSGKHFPIKFRFFLSRKMIEAEIPHAKELSHPDGDISVTDLTVYFSGREELFNFMKKWLGSYCVVGEGEWFVGYFRERIEEYLDNMVV